MVSRIITASLAIVFVVFYNGCTYNKYYYFEHGHKCKRVKICPKKTECDKPVCVAPKYDPPKYVEPVKPIAPSPKPLINKVEPSKKDMYIK